MRHIDISTTITGQIIAFKITDYMLLFMFVGFLLYFISKKETVKNVGLTIFAFGLLTGAFMTLIVQSSSATIAVLHQHR